MEIKNNHIKEAEAILINGNTFDEKERVPFIKNLETRDLLAVPGSGKTTALQAKLYCLARQMPFDAKSGVLVLSHTNKAVEEIEKKLKYHCPQLFQYPNFVGTVQSFVNDILAKPYYCICYKQKIGAIDTEYFNSRFSALALNTFSAIKETKLLFRTPNIDWLYNFDIVTDQKGNYIYNRENRNRVLLKKPYGRTKPCNYHDWSDETKSKIENNIINLKNKIFSYGVLSFEDCYMFAKRYINRYPQIKDIIQKRFKYIFIDEAQDLEKHQLDIIESIFHSQDSNCVLQRIGDINQAIYSNGKSIKVECAWVPRNPLHLNSSLRLTKEVADIVNCFTLKKDFIHNDSSHEFNVIGEGRIEQKMQPHLIIFDDITINKLKSKFEELIIKYDLFDGLEGINTQKGYKIIGWSGTWQNEDNKGKLRLENIFPNEYKTLHISRKSKVCLCDYLIFNSKNTTLKKYSDDIIEALSTILRIAGCVIKNTRNDIETQRYYTNQTLWRYIFEESRKTDGKLSEQDMLDFKSKLYTWSLSIATNDHIESVYNDIKSFITEKFSTWFDFAIGAEVSVFLGTNYENIDLTDIDVTPHTSSNIPIEICSVHSVKGQTHCATMYIETFYKGYETNKLLVQSRPATKKKRAEYFNNPLLMENHNFKNNKNLQAKETIKMMYVGFSRPTHLLCFAIHKNNVTENYFDFFKHENCGWIIEDLTTKLK